jgi:hypothetical protein
LRLPHTLASLDTRIRSDSLLVTKRLAVTKSLVIFFGKIDDEYQGLDVILVLFVIDGEEPERFVPRPTREKRRTGKRSRPPPLFLASSDSSFATDIELFVDGVVAET